MLKTAFLLSNISRVFLVLILFSLFLMLPQINIQEYVLSTITSKFIYFLYACIALLGFYILHVVSNQKKQYSFSKLDLALFALLGYITINRYFIQSHYGFSIRYMELLGLSFLYVVLRHISLKNYYWLLLSVIISGIMQAVYGNLQLLGYYPSNHSGFKMTGSFFNPGPYAGFLVSVWAVALGMYLFKDSITIQVQSQTKSKHKCNIDQLFNLTPSPSPLERGAIAYKTDYFNQFIKYTFEYIPLLGLISISIVLPALQSRASWIAVLVGSVVVVELRYRFLSNLFKKVTAKLQKTALMLLAIGILSTGLFSIYHYKKASSDGRAFIWKVTTEMIADAPVFGVGFDLFKAHYMEYQAQYFQKNGETSEAVVADNTYYAFNEGLQFVAENGLLGLLFLMIVVYVLSKTKVKEMHQLNSFIAKTGLLTIAVFACFSYPMQILPIKLVIVFLLAMLSNSTADTFQLKILTPSPSPHERQRTGEAMELGTSKTIVNSVLYKLTIVLLSCAGIYQIFAYTKDLSQGFITWNNALISHQYGDYKEAVLDFELAYPIFKKDGDFLMNYGKTLAMAGEPHKAIVVLEQVKHYQNNTIIATALGDSYKATKQYDKAEIAYKKAASMIPSRFYPLYLLVKLYDDSGNILKARAMANTILNKEVKIPSTAIKEIKAEMRKIKINFQ